MEKVNTKATRIPCTVGILTYNCEATLARCLESVKEFGEIIVADGGSTDSTLAIARKYGALIMEQSNPGHGIEDFALERNRQVERAGERWFFYLDADEIATEELVREIQNVCSDPNPTHRFFEIRQQNTSEDGTVWYRMWKPVYQVRLWDRTTGARMTKRIHEKVRYDREKYSAGRIEAPWLVPLETRMSFVRMHKKAVRNARIIDDYTSKNPFDFLYHEWASFFEIVKRTVKYLVLRVRYGKREVAPLRFELYSMYDTGYGMWRYLRRYTRNLLNLP